LAKRQRKQFSKGPQTPEFRINGFIKVPEIRLVGDNLEDIAEVAGRNIEPGIYTTKEANRWAREMDLDLVEISPKANPPVCKIIDYKIWAKYGRSRFRFQIKTCSKVSRRWC